ncbi:alpha/beta fold hydrolase [Gordonia sp. MP11Mi]|uniref:Alpha/beta hydrolase n=1 Tax=Gordonia sp. MP11Mi TaxID=3022769 RepID=A0AA97CXW2_9ACTN
MTTVIVMPGTGSDADFAARVFGPSVRDAGASLECLEPEPDLIESYLTRIDAIADRGDRVIVGGVSIGAAIALRWACDPAHSARCDGVLAALPPWTGRPDGSLAALSAQITADNLARDGLDATVAAMVASSPAWLGAELARSWRALYPSGLVAQLRAAAMYVGPTLNDVATLPIPLGVAVAPDDPLHPAAVGRAWADAARQSVVAEAPLAEFGPDERLLGDTCWAALAAARQV